jgi:tRNA nucleotidyltransferase (CCA-adding enzyme)
MIEDGMSIENDVLKAILPDHQIRERVNKVSADLMTLVEKVASNYPITLQIRLVGSVAKDTYVGEPDIDVFILFPEDTPRTVLENVGLSIGRAVVDGEERYAEHPYIHGMFQGFQVDLVPCYKLLNALHIKSAVDRTPFHTEYILSNLRLEQHDQVRLLKQFMKGIGVYGADAKVCGFSGYLAELLILRYGDFATMVKAGADWTSGTVLSMTGEPAAHFRSPLVFIDPVDSNRNVASALTVNSFATFVWACQQYSRRCDRRFFFPEPAMPCSVQEASRKLDRLGTRILGVRTSRPDLTDDNLYPQTQRTMEGLVGLLGQHGFNVVDQSYLVSESITFVMMVETDQLSDSTLHLGPPVWVENSARFLERWLEEGAGLPFIKDGRWAVMVDREWPYAADLLRNRFKDAALGSEFRKLNGIEVFDHQSLLSPGFEEAVSKMLDKRFAWER